MQIKTPEPYNFSVRFKAKSNHYHKKATFTMHLTSPLLLVSLLCFSTHVFATVGGGQSLEFLGYDAKDQKLYVLRDFEDGRGRLPQLYYYQFNQKKTEPKLIEVKSLYINPKTQKVDYDQDGIQFEKALNKIKKRLKPLTAQNLKGTQLHILKETNKTIPHIYETNEKMTEYHYQYQVSSGQYKSQPHTAISYKPDLKIDQVFLIPQQPYKVVSIQYLAFPEETGYTTEDPVLLRKK